MRKTIAAIFAIAFVIMSASAAWATLETANDLFSNAPDALAAEVTPGNSGIRFFGKLGSVSWYKFPTHTHSEETDANGNYMSWTNDARIVAIMFVHCHPGNVPWEQAWPDHAGDNEYAVPIMPEYSCGSLYTGGTYGYIDGHVDVMMTYSVLCDFTRIADKKAGTVTTLDKFTCLMPLLPKDRPIIANRWTSDRRYGDPFTEQELLAALRDPNVFDAQVVFATLPKDAKIITSAYDHTDYLALYPHTQKLSLNEMISNRDNFAKDSDNDGFPDEYSNCPEYNQKTQYSCPVGDYFLNKCLDQLKAKGQSAVSKECADGMKAGCALVQADRDDDGIGDACDCDKEKGNPQYDPTNQCIPPKSASTQQPDDHKPVKYFSNVTSDYGVKLESNAITFFGKFAYGMTYDKLPMEKDGSGTSMKIGLWRADEHFWPADPDYPTWLGYSLKMSCSPLDSGKAFKCVTDIASFAAKMSNSNGKQYSPVDIINAFKNKDDSISWHFGAGIYGGAPDDYSPYISIKSGEDAAAKYGDSNNDGVPDWWGSSAASQGAPADSAQAEAEKAFAGEFVARQRFSVTLGSRAAGAQAASDTAIVSSTATNGLVNSTDNGVVVENNDLSIKEKGSQPIGISIQNGTPVDGTGNSAGNAKAFSLLGVTGCSFVPTAPANASPILLLALSLIPLIRRRIG